MSARVFFAGWKSEACAAAGRSQQTRAAGLNEERLEDMEADTHGKS